MTNVILDTNVVVSAYLSPNGAPHKVLQSFQDYPLQLLVSNAILGEYKRVFSYRKISTLLEKAQIDTDSVLQHIASIAKVVEPKTLQEVAIRDRDDRIFLECAQSANADLIVSGDIHLLELGRYSQTEIVTPAIFLAILPSL